MKTYRAAIAGAGFMAGAHAEALRRIEGVELVAVVGLPGETAAMTSLCPGAVYTSLEEMLERETVDVLHICTPNHTHRAIAEAAMERGLHILCEKPLATAVDDAGAMVACAQRYGVQHAVNFHNRFYPMLRELRERVREGAMGELIAVHGSYLQDWLLQKSDYNWRLHSRYAGRTRAVADIGSHWMDAVTFITGRRVTEVFADLRTYHETRCAPSRSSAAPGSGVVWEEIPIDTEDHAHILLRFEGGLVGSLTVSQMFAGIKNSMAISMAGSERSAIWDSERPGVLTIGSRSGCNELLQKNTPCLHDSANSLSRYPAGHVEGFPDAVMQMVRSFYASLNGEEPAPAYATFHDGLYAALLCDRIFESAQSGRWVQVEPVHYQELKEASQ